MSLVLYIPHTEGDPVIRAEYHTSHPYSVGIMSALYRLSWEIPTLGITGTSLEFHTIPSFDDISNRSPSLAPAPPERVSFKSPTHCDPTRLTDTCHGVFPVRIGTPHSTGVVQAKVLSVSALAYTSGLCAGIISTAHRCQKLPSHWKDGDTSLRTVFVDLYTTVAGVQSTPLVDVLTRSCSWPEEIVSSNSLQNT